MWVHNCDGKRLSEFIWENCPQFRIDPEPRQGCSSDKRLNLSPVLDHLGISRPALLAALKKGKLRYRHIVRIRELAVRNGNSSISPIETWLTFASEEA